MVVQNSNDSLAGDTLAERSVDAGLGRHLEEGWLDMDCGSVKEGWVDIGTNVGQSTELSALSCGGMMLMMAIWSCFISRRDLYIYSKVYTLEEVPFSTWSGSPIAGAGDRASGTSDSHGKDEGDA